jgi:hypothetical protein
MTRGSLLTVLHRSSIYDDQNLSKNEKKSNDKSKYIVFHGKQQVIGVGDVFDLEDFNQFSDMSLFTYHRVKIKSVEHSNPHNSLPWVRPDGQGKTIDV